MTRRELCLWMEELRLAAQAADSAASSRQVEQEVLRGLTDAMLRRRGIAVDEAADMSAPLRKLFEKDEAADFLDQDDGLGQAYQALHVREIEAAYRGTAKDRRKFTDAEIPAVSQLFTPRWVVEFLVQNTLGRLWIDRHPDTRLKANWRWLIESLAAPAVQSDSFPSSVKELRLLDPACGTMNFGLVAFELLRDMYLEECDCAGRPGWPAPPPVARRDDIAASVLANNLFGVDIDPIALELARSSLAMKIGVQAGAVRCNLALADSLSHPAPFDDVVHGFDVVATNPPYVSARNLPTERVAALKKQFPRSWRDLYGCFIERCLELTRSGGRCGLLTMQSFMFTGSYQRLRQAIAEQAILEAIAHFGPGLFGVGNPGTLQTVAFVAMKRGIGESDATRPRASGFPERFSQSCSVRSTPARLAGLLASRVSRDTKLKTAPGPASADATTFAIQAARPGKIASAIADPAKIEDGSSNEALAPSLIAFRLTSVPAEDKESALQRALEALREESASVPSSCMSEPKDIFRLSQQSLSDLPRNSWAYWVDGPLRRAFKKFPRLADLSLPRQGLATTDNFRFVRYWWEVEPTHCSSEFKATPGRWIGYSKGGQFRRWYEAPRHRVNWQDDGREIKQAIVDRYPYLEGQWKWVAKNVSYYGRGGVTWSYLTSGRFSARRLETGAIFDVAGSSFFPDDVPGMLAVLNSSAAAALLGAINPTVNFQVGDLAELPIPQPIPAELASLATTAIALQQQLDVFDETTADFISPMPWIDATERGSAMAAELAGIERKIDACVCALYGLGVPARDETPAAVVDLTDLARRWISFAIGRLLGRWNAGDPGRVLQILPADPRLMAEIRTILDQFAGPGAVDDIAGQVKRIERFLAVDFFPWHVRLYRRRPPIWALAGPGALSLLAHDSAGRDTLVPIVRRLGQSMPAGWSRKIDDGIGPGLAPLRAMVPDLSLRRVLDQIDRDDREGRLPWMAASNR